MLEIGTGTTSKDELDKALQLSPLMKGAEGENILKLLDLANNENFSLKSANALFTGPSYHVFDQYKQDIKSIYGAEVKTLQFGEPSATNAINSWAEQNTNGKITELLQETHADTILMLVNAVYMKGKWEKVFHSMNTKTATFHSQNGDISASFMSLKEHFPYVDKSEDGYRVAFLGYKGENSRSSDWEMAIVLPEERRKPEEFVSAIHGDNLVSLRSKASSPKLDLKLPKVKVESEIDMIPILQKVGIEAIFDGKADMSGICDNCYVDSVKQKTRIEVDEEGTEAAAVMSMQAIPYRGESVRPVDFNVNRPFLLTVFNRRTGLSAFSAIINKPSPPVPPRECLLVKNEKKCFW